MKLYYEGEYRTVVFACDESGRHRAEQYLAGLNNVDRSKIDSRIRFHCNSEAGLRGKEKIRFEGGHVWVIKIFKRRVYFYTEGRTLYLTHGADKKADKADPRQFEITRRIRTHHMSEEDAANDGRQGGKQGRT